MRLLSEGRRGLALLLAGGVALLAGCASAPNQGQAVATLGLAALPSYSAGEAVIFDNRRLEQVVSTRNGRTLWQDQRGYRFTKDDNFIVPTLSRQGRKGVYAHRVIKGDPSAIWPLGRGASVRFDVLYVRPDQREFTQLWRCDDRGARRIDQHGKSYDTYLVECVRSYEVSNFNRYRSEQVNYFYDPKLQLVVRRDSIDLRNRREPRQLRLWAYLRPEDATDGQIEAIRTALKSRQ